MADMEWLDYATPAERKTLAKLDKIETAAVAARAEKRAIYDRCRKRMERANAA